MSERYFVTPWNSGLSTDRTRYAVIDRNTGQRHWTYSTREKADDVANGLNAPKRNACSCKTYAVASAGGDGYGSNWTVTDGCPVHGDD